MRRWAILSLVLGTPVAGGLIIGFMLFLGQVQQQPPAQVEHAQGMVVLTGGADRIADAIELFARGYADRLLITGVNPAITKSEIARLNPRSGDLIECCVDLGYEALNTIGNAREARVWAEKRDISQSIIVVTSHYHMPRAMAEMQHELRGFELRAYPVVTPRMREARWWRSFHAARVLGTEYLKYVIALVRLTTLA